MHHNTRGFTLLEVMIASLLLAFILLAVAPLFIHSIEANAAGADLGSVGAIAVDRMEQLRRQPYANLDAGGSLVSDVTLAGINYFDLSDPDFIVRWQIVDSATAVGGKRITVRVLAVRQVAGLPKEVTLSFSEGGLMQDRKAAGFSLVELLVSLTALLLVMAGICTLLTQNARINKSEKMAARVQSNARACLSLVVQRLRSAGWDPINKGISIVTLDPDTSDAISQIEIFADLDMDGFTTSADEQVLIRHVNGVVEWRTTSDTSTPFRTVATHISNDADGDGIIEPMFVPDSTIDPTFVTVRITARSPVVDPITRDFIRYTVSSEVSLRKNL